MTQPSANEQYMLELINADRAEAGAQPLAFDSDLLTAAEEHSQWMIASDTFSHTGADSSSPTQRMESAGYDFTGSWGSAENIAWATERAPAGEQDEVQLLHTSLMNSPGHRANLLNADYHEIGIGFETGDHQGRQSAFVTEDFAHSGSGSELTGVAFDDTDGDKSYDPGEGLGSIAVKVVDASGHTYATTTMDAGGYRLDLPAGTYEVTFSGGGTAATTEEITIGAANVKLDLVDPAKADATAGDPATTQPVPEPDSAPTETSSGVTDPDPSGDDPGQSDVPGNEGDSFVFWGRGKVGWNVDVQKHFDARHLQSHGLDFAKLDAGTTATPEQATVPADGDASAFHHVKQMPAHHGDFLL